MTHPHQQISLPTAILININIMLGVGMFINTTNVAQHAGILGGLSYVTIGLLMLPLVMSIAYLLRLHPDGGFYTYGSKELSNLAGFVSTWAYFMAKLASAAVMIHSAVLLIQQIIPSLVGINPLIADLIIITLFAALNMLHIKTGSAIQILFICCKSFPILFLFAAAFLLLNGNNFTTPYQLWSGIPSTLPIVLYSAIGFEAVSSISNKIKDAHKNAPKAVLISYATVMVIACLFQTFFFSILGNTFATFTRFYDAFPALLSLMMPNHAHVGAALARLLHLGIALSALGGSYGILFSNNWNFYMLAKHGHVFGASRFIQFNRYDIPWLCITTEGIICGLYLLITGGKIDPLMQLAGLGSIIAYAISVIALLHARHKRPETKVPYLVPLLGLLSCSLLASKLVTTLMNNGTYALVLFGILLCFGISMFYITRTKSTTAI